MNKIIAIGSNEQPFTAELMKRILNQPDIIGELIIDEQNIVEEPIILDSLDMILDNIEERPVVNSNNKYHSKPWKKSFYYNK